MIIPFGEALSQLQKLDSLPQRHSDLGVLALDALYGSMYEEKFRGSLGEHSNFPMLVHRAIERLEKVPNEAELTAPEHSLSINGKVGWGTYHWNYDLEIPSLALEYGAAIIDTAEGYGFSRVEYELGRVLREHPMTPTCIATKPSRTHMSFDAVQNAARRSQNRLGRIDLYQIHWPNPSIPIEETLLGMAELVNWGVVKALGVCNFSLDQFWLAKQIYPDLCSIQLRFTHFGFMCDFYRKSGHYMIVHSPFGQGTIRESTACRTTLRWIATFGGIAIPGTNNPQHLLENLQCEMPLSLEVE